MAYTLTGEKFGTVRFKPFEGTVTKESVSYSSKVTSNPVEKGADINDHVIANPEQLSLTGTVVGGKDAADRLISMWRTGCILSYAGRSRLNGIVITSLKMDYDAKNQGGFSFSLSFQKVNIASSKQMDFGEQPLMSEQDGIKTANDGLKTTASAAISSGAYAEYVNSYLSKPAGSSGPSSRKTPSYNGISRRQMYGPDI